MRVDHRGASAARRAVGSGGSVEPEACERIAGDAGDPPVGQERRAHLLVEPDGGRVPIEHRPFEASAAALASDTCKRAEQRLRAALPAVRRPAGPLARQLIVSYNVAHTLGG